jgi:hypothetical protein
MAAVLADRQEAVGNREPGPPLTAASRRFTHLHLDAGYTHLRACYTKAPTLALGPGEGLPGPPPTVACPWGRLPADTDRGPARPSS